MNQPLVTIGMPVYNGEKYLQEAIDSLLAQTYQHFEILISDDGSTDLTLDIIKNYARQDNRIKLMNHGKRFGMVKNYEYLTQQISGEFFFYADQDDVWLPTFIEECLKGFQENHEVQSVCVQTESISENFEEVFFIDPGLTTISSSPAKRFISYRKKLDGGLEIGALCCGMYRKELIQKLPPYDEIIGFDHVLVAKGMMLGKYTARERVLLKKRSGGASVNKESLQEAHGSAIIEHSLRIYAPREKSMQRMIWSLEKVNFFDKCSASLWSLLDYLRRYELPLIKQRLLRAFVD